MRVRHWVLVGASALFIFGIAATGCGGSDESTPAADAGHDQSVADQVTPTDTGGPDIVDTGAACQSDADLNQLNLPDAAIPDTGTSVGVCLGCVKSTCSNQFKDCNDDPCCNGLIVGVFQCVASGTGFVQCATPLLGGSVPPTASALGTCAALGCRSACLGSAAGDAASDAPSDAAHDG
jgi:hypothetical protein